MKYQNKIIFSSFLVFFIFSLFSYVEAEKWEKSEEPVIDSGVTIPKHEFVGYYDSNGVYTVVGAIKNNERFTVIPTIIINIQDEKQTFTRSLEYVPITPSNELPFKIKFPEVIGMQPILKEPEISYVLTEKNPLNIEVIYDETLIQHDDGHITGRIINNGNQTIYNVKVYAIIHGFEHETLDMAQNMKWIEKLEPGQIQNFSMYPDPSVAEEVFYYSCFAVTDSFVKPLNSERNENKFYFRYDSTSWYTDPQFNQEGTELTMRTLNSFPLETYANFEFPKFSDDEKFDVYVNDEKKDSIQSIDEWGNWHVAYTVEPREGGEIVITGFEKGWDPGKRIFIPDWVKINAAWWSEGEIPDETFIDQIEFLIKEEIIKVNGDNSNQPFDSKVPEWIKTYAGWWTEGKINDETFVIGLEFLIKKGVIQI